MDNSETFLKMGASAGISAGHPDLGRKHLESARVMDNSETDEKYRGVKALVVTSWICSSFFTIILRQL
jgi:hypothetical protein